MSLSRSHLAWPGPGRLTLVLLAVIPAALAYPWSSTRDRWVLGAAVLVTVALLGCWRGLHLTTMVRRRLAMLRTHREAADRRRPDVRTTALLQLIGGPADTATLPLSLIAAYRSRYGLQADAVRITSREQRSGAHAPTRDTWIGLTFSAVQNLPALQARSPHVPLAETAEVAVRRLGDQLRELGWETVLVGPGEVPALAGADARERWNGLADDTGWLAAYRVDIGADGADAVAHLGAGDAPETWTVLEISGDAEQVTLAVGRAIRTEQAPAGAPPGLTPEYGNHRVALQTLHPMSSVKLAGHAGVPAANVAALHWPVAPDARHPARHAAVN